MRKLSNFVIRIDEKTKMMHIKVFMAHSEFTCVCCTVIVCCLHSDIIMRVTVIIIVLLCYLSTVMEVCSQTVPYIRFMGTNLPNHSYIDFTQVGEGNNSVRCHTDLITCCRAAHGPHRGDWYSPRGSRLPFVQDATDGVNEKRKKQRVDLRVGGSPTLIEGIYHYGIETSATSNDNRETVFVGLYLSKRGQYVCSHACIEHVLGQTQCKALRDEPDFL